MLPPRPACLLVLCLLAPAAAAQDPRLQRRGQIEEAQREALARMDEAALWERRLSDLRGRYESEGGFGRYREQRRAVREGLSAAAAAMDASRRSLLQLQQGQQLMNVVDLVAMSRRASRSSSARETLDAGERILDLQSQNQFLDLEQARHDRAGSALAVEEAFFQAESDRLRRRWLAALSGCAASASALLGFILFLRRRKAAAPAAGLLALLLASRALAGAAIDLRAFESELSSLRAAMERIMGELSGRIDRLEAVDGSYPKGGESRRGLARGEVSESAARLEKAVEKFNFKRNALGQICLVLPAMKAKSIRDSAAFDDFRRKLASQQPAEDEARSLLRRARRALADEEARRAAFDKAGRDRALRAWGGFGASLGLAAVAWAWVRSRRRSRKASAPRPRIPAASNLEGVRVGAYRIKRERGGDGLGPLFDAEEASGGAEALLRRLREDLRMSDKDREAVMAEALRVSGLSHPNILRLAASFVEGGRIFLAYEQFQGRSLSEMLDAGGRISVRSAKGVIVQAAAALDHARSAGILHLGLEPGRLLVSPEGRAKAMDFAIAARVRLIEARNAPDEAVTASPYLAPEQEVGGPEAVSDVFGLGVIAYRMATGRLPFPGPDFLEQKRAMAYKPASRFVPVSGLDRVLGRALAAEPATRWPTAGEFAAAFQALPD
jgi:hypothetical protein